MVGPYSPVIFLQDQSGALVVQSGTNTNPPVYDYQGKVARIIPNATAVDTSGMGRLLVDAAIASGNATIHLASGSQVSLVDTSGIPVTTVSGSFHFFPQNYVGLITPSPMYGFLPDGTSGVLTGGSGTNFVSGQYVRMQMTTPTTVDPFNRLLVAVSGQPIRITDASGASIATVQPPQDGISGRPALWTIAVLAGFNAPGGHFSQVRVTESGSAGSASGTDFKLKVYISGSSVMALVSGQTIWFVSGKNIVQGTPPTQVLSTTDTTISTASGGTRLSNVPCITATVRYNPGLSGFMFVAGNASPPHSGRGLRLQPGEFVTMNINNLNAIRICATRSGDSVSVMAVDY